VIVKTEGGELPDLQERRAGVQQPHDPITRQELASAGVALTALSRSAQSGRAGALLQLRHQRTVQLGVGDIGLGCDVDSGLEFPHAVFSSTRFNSAIIASRIANFCTLPVT